MHYHYRQCIIKKGSALANTHFASTLNSAANYFIKACTPIGIPAEGSADKNNRKFGWLFLGSVKAVVVIITIGIVDRNMIDFAENQNLYISMHECKCHSLLQRRHVACPAQCTSAASCEHFGA